MATEWKRKGLWTSVILVSGMTLTYLIWTGKPVPASVAPPPPGPAVVDVMAAEPQLRQLEVRTQGTVRPLREMNLVSEVAGRVESVAQRFAEGSFFARNDTLARIEDVDYELAIAQAQSDVAAAEQRVAEEMGRSRQASREWRELGSSEANELFLRKPQLAAAKASLVAAKANLASAQLDLERTQLTMPFNGRVIQKHVDMGQYVTPGTTVARIYDTDVAEIRLPLTDRQVALLDLPLSYDEQIERRESGAPVTFSARFAGELWQWQGVVVRTDASIDVNSRVVYAVAEVPRPFAREEGSGRPPLSPGLFVDATITGRAMEHVSVLPRSALRSNQAVMVVDAKGLASERDVRVLQSTASQVWLQGLAEGERVIVREPTLTLAGAQVQAREVGQLASSAR
ncbi:MAG: efflux RND transporter periplasmic adaptor subunit [Pseudomonadota bacterium]